MTDKLDIDRLEVVFDSRPDIVSGVKAAADSSPRIHLFNEIIAFAYERFPDEQNGPAHKKRRIAVDQSGSSTQLSNGHRHLENETADLEIKDVSLSMPQRKKFDLCFTNTFLRVRAPGATEFSPDIKYAWNDIEHVFCLPVPEKAQLQYNYILLPTRAALASLSKAPASPALEPLVFTVPTTAPKPGSVGGPSAADAAAVSDTYCSLVDWAIRRHLAGVGNNHTKIITTDAKVFHSLQRQAHRPNEKAVHVKAFRGSKDGYMFFLPTGILWGFKKPLLFLPLDRIVAVSYTNILQRTFNIVIEVDVMDGHNEEIEFAMVDQEDYNSIDESYVRRHGLQDRSMADQRKAKRELAENAKSGGKASAEGASGTQAGSDPTAPDDGLTELQRAEQQLQDEEDEEDEEEEDYDPGSDGDSGGSGESDEEDYGSGEDDGDADEEEEEDG